MVEAKVELRKKILARIRSLSEDEIERRSKNVARNISGLSIYKKSRVIMGYYPLKGEVNLLGMFRKVLGQKKVCFPVIEQRRKNLIPYYVGNLEEDFVKGPYGVMEPDVHKATPASVDEIDLVLVPGVAFGENKYRLGRGGGFYDRFLSQLDGHTAKVGVAMDCQIVPDLPVNLSHDQPVDWVVTETKVF